MSGIWALPMWSSLAENVLVANGTFETYEPFEIQGKIASDERACRRVGSWLGCRPMEEVGAL